MRVLTAGDVSTLLRGLDEDGARNILDILAQGLVAYSKEARLQDSSQRRIIQPARTVFTSPARDVTLVMPVSDSSQTTVKTVTVPSSGDIAGAITVFEPKGRLRGVLNAAEITAFRTALAVMVLLVRWPASRDVKIVVFGAGKQVEWHVRLLLLLLSDVNSVTVVNRGKARLETLEKETLSKLRASHPSTTFHTVAKEGHASYKEDVTARLKDADIICCCTPSREPHFAASDLPIRQGRTRFLSMIGSYTPEMQEVDTETLLASHTVFVDSKEACLAEAGELIRARYVAEDLVEIGEWIGHGPSAKIDPQASLTVIKSVGFGLMDLIVAKALLDMAEEQNLGLVVDNF